MSDVETRDFFWYNLKQTWKEYRCTSLGSLSQRNPIRNLLMHIVFLVDIANIPPPPCVRKYFPPTAQKPQRAIGLFNQRAVFLNEYVGWGLCDTGVFLTHCTVNEVCSMPLRGGKFRIFVG